MAITHFDDRTARPHWRGKRLLCWWVLASALWLAAVTIGFCGKVTEQIDATREIGRELQAMDCQSGAAVKCAQDGLADYEGSWTGTAALFATFGFWQIFPVAILPPAAILFFGFAACGCSKVVRRGR